MNQQKPPWYYLIILILAGESVFILPFVLARVFRPTVLETFGIDNLQLGYCFSVYGIVALISYLLGGPLADKLSPRKPIAISLWSTALGGLLYSTFPNYTLLKLLYAYWGMTTILLFWAPMIKATRAWGGPSSQGKAFGFLDAGRGLVGALFGLLGVLVFSTYLTTEITESSLSQNQSAFRLVIIVSSCIVATVGCFVWWFMKLDQDTEKSLTLDIVTLDQVMEVLRLRSVRLLMIIVLCAYTGYKTTDVFSLYAQDVMLYNQVQSAQVGTFLLFLRPVVGITLGLLADRTQPARWLFISFIIAFFGSLIFALGWVNASSSAFFFFSILVIAIGVYALRTLYFAVMKNGQIPLVFTGTAVGLISLIGFTPDIFAGPILGYLLDSSPGIAGHQHVFWLLAGFSTIGLLTSWYYYILYGRDSKAV